jgi:hypothetical protein
MHTHLHNQQGDMEIKKDDGDMEIKKDDGDMEIKKDDGDMEIKKEDAGFPKVFICLWHAIATRRV